MARRPDAYFMAWEKDNSKAGMKARVLSRIQTQLRSGTSSLGHLRRSAKLMLQLSRWFSKEGC